MEQVRRLVHQLRTEASTPARDAVAIGLGTFIGCSPWYGLHLLLCWLLGRLLRLNRLKMYLASNVSNPFVAPILILIELQTGSWIRRGTTHPLTIDSMRSTDPWTFGADILAGSVVVGLVLGIGAGVATWLGTRTGDRDPFFSALVARASDRYVRASITAWEFARGKMRGDPLYRTVLMDGLLPSGGVLVDVGCGQGLMLALLAEAGAVWRSGGWPGPHPPPVFEALIGIETRRRVAGLAQKALGDAATIVAADARTHLRCAVARASEANEAAGRAGGAKPLAEQTLRVVLFFDVLHMMPAEDQVRLLQQMAGALEPGGVMLVREADAGAGWRFSAVRAGNRLKAVLFGHWRQTFHFRPAAEWRDVLAQTGFEIRERESSQGTPFGNVLFTVSRRADASV